MIMVCTILGMKTYIFDSIGIVSFFPLVISGVFAYLLTTYLSDLLFNLTFANTKSCSLKTAQRG